MSKQLFSLFSLPHSQHCSSLTNRWFKNPFTAVFSIDVAWSEWKQDTTVFEFLKNSSNFQVLYQKKQLFRETNESKSANSKTEIVDALKQNTSAIFSSSWKQSKSMQRLFWKLSFCIPNNNRVWKLGTEKSLQNCCHQDKQLFLYSMEPLIKLIVWH